MFVQYCDDRCCHWTHRDWRHMPTSQIKQSAEFWKWFTHSPSAKSIFINRFWGLVSYCCLNRFSSSGSINQVRSNGLCFREQIRKHTINCIPLPSTERPEWLSCHRRLVVLNSIDDMCWRQSAHLIVNIYICSYIEPAHVCPYHNTAKVSLVQAIGYKHCKSWAST